MFHPQLNRNKNEKQNQVKKANKHTREYQPHAIAPQQRHEKKVLITHKYRGLQPFSITKSVEPNEEQKA